MPIGELPNEFGFLVLGADELATLFALDEQLLRRIPCEGDAKYAERLLAVEVPKWSGQLRIREALEALESRSVRELEDLRSRPPGKPDEARRAGRRSARIAMTIANVRVTLRRLANQAAPAMTKSLPDAVL